MTGTCRECGAPFERAPGKPRVCDACLPAFRERLTREGTPIARYAYPESEPPRVSRRVNCLNQAAIADSCSGWS